MRIVELRIRRDVILLHMLARPRLHVLPHRLGDRLVWGGVQGRHDVTRREREGSLSQDMNGPREMSS